MGLVAILPKQLYTYKLLKMMQFGCEKKKHTLPLIICLGLCFYVSNHYNMKKQA